MFKKRSPIFLLYIEDKIQISLSQKCVKITKVRIFKGFLVYWGVVKIIKANSN